VEGARIAGEMVYEPLCSLEQRVVAHQIGLPLEKWNYLRFLVEKVLRDGVLDRVREEILQGYYAQEKLQLIAPNLDSANFVYSRRLASFFVPPNAAAALQCVSMCSIIQAGQNGASHCAQIWQ
jgi:hypothetical protein